MKENINEIYSHLEQLDFLVKDIESQLLFFVKEIKGSISFEDSQRHFNTIEGILFDL